MTHISDNQFMDPSFSLADGLEWLHKNTNFPTFEQFRKDPDKYRESQTEIFECIENLNVQFKERVKSVKYFWRGKYECTLGKIYTIAKEEGCLGNLEMEPIIEPMDGSSNGHDNRLAVIVNVWPKDEFRAQGGIVANDT